MGKDFAEQGIAFNEPGGGWVPRGEYLTGRVKQKLLEAQEAARTDPSYQPNVIALEEAQPEDKPYSQISTRLGATWIPATDVAQFMADQMSEDVSKFSVQYSATAGAWAVSYSDSGSRLRRGVKDSEELGTKDYGFPAIVESAITDRAIMIRRKVPGSQTGETYLDRQASAAATKKVKEIRKRFDRWIWQDDARRQRLHRKYNDTFNDTVPLRADGSHQTFPGMNPIIAEEWRSGTRSHQPNAVYRAVTRGVAMVAHEVGIGKTFTMVATGMERRRLGLSRKPAIACLNSNIAAITADARWLYPNARILAAHEGMGPEQRQKTITQMATGDWDLVILTHDNLDLVAMSAETQQKFIRKEMEELEAAVLAAKAANPDGEKDKAGNRIVKQLENTLADRQAALQNILSKPKDQAMTFEETGIDFLMVDEAHYFKSLPVYTSRGNVKGIPNTKSDRATNMYMRTQWLLERNNGQGVVFATGTPISNTMVELFNMQRFLQTRDLAVRGVERFDAWAAVFGETSSKHEFKPTGDWKVTTRFNKFTNLPQLAQMASEVFDVAFAKDIAGIIRPTRDDQVITLPMNDGQSAYLEVIKQRAEALALMKGPPQKGDDNWLVLDSDARKSAIDMRLINREFEDDPGSKLNRMVADTLEFIEANPGKTQLIFSDMGINPSPKGISLYVDIIEKLVKGGIARDKIIDFSKFAPANKNHQKAKAIAMERMLSGDALIGIGGTAKMGTGLNVQRNLAVLRHLDAPPRPSDIEQRDGRGWRHGNDNETIGIIRYTTEGSFDVHSWQVLDGKNTFIRQFLAAMSTGANVPESFEDQDDEFNYARVMAITSGNPLLVAKMEAERELEELESDFDVFQDSQLRMRDRTSMWARNIAKQQEELIVAEKDLPVYKESLDKPWAVTIEGTEYTRDLEEEKAAAAKESETREAKGKLAQEKKDLKLIVNALKAQAKERGLKGGKETTAYILEQQPKIVARLEALEGELEETESEPTKISIATKAFRKKITDEIEAVKGNWNLMRQLREEGVSESFAKYRGFDIALTSKTYTDAEEKSQTNYFPVLIGPSGHHYGVNWAITSPGGVFDAIDRQFERMDRDQDDTRLTIANSQKQINDAAPLLDTPFPEQAELDAKRREVDVLTQQLTASSGKLPLPEGYADLSDRYLPDGKLKADEAPLEILGEGEEWVTNEFEGQPAFMSPTRDLILLGVPTGPSRDGRNPEGIRRGFSDTSTEGERVAPFAIEDLSETVLFTDGTSLPLSYLDLVLGLYPNASFYLKGQKLSIADGKKVVGVALVKKARELEKELQSAARTAVVRATMKAESLAAAEKLIADRAERRKSGLYHQLRGAPKPLFEAAVTKAGSAPSFVQGAMNRKERRAQEKAQGIRYMRAGADPYALIDEIIIFGWDAYKAARPKFEAWAKEVRKEFGEVAEPHLRHVYFQLSGIQEPEAKSPKAGYKITTKTATAAKPAENITETITEPTPAKPAPPSRTSARMAQMTADRAELDLPELPPAERKSWQDTLDRAKVRGTANAGILADEVIAKPRALNEVETAQLVLRAQEVKNAYAGILAEIGDSTDDSVIQTKRFEAEAFQLEFDKLTKALKASGSEKGRALASQKLTINQDYDLISLVQRAKAAKGRNLRPKERARIEQQAARIAELEKLLKNARRRAERKIIQKTIITVRRRASRPTAKKKLEDEFAELRAQFAKAKLEIGSVQASGLAGLDPEGKLTILIVKMARNRIKAGAIEVEAMIEQVHNAIKDYIDISKDDLRTLLSQHNLDPDVRDPLPAIKTRLRARENRPDAPDCRKGLLTRPGPSKTRLRQGSRRPQGQS